MTPHTNTEARTSWVIVLAATFAGIAVAMQIGKAAATLPLIRDEFSAGLTLLATYVALISIVAASIGLGFGAITRRMGARRAGLLGLWLVALGSGLGALADTVSFLLFTRLIEAIGFALSITAMPALIQPATRPQDRVLALGIWATWLPAGVAAAMAVSFFGLETLGWRGMFWTTALVPAAAALILLMVAPRDVAANAPKSSPLAALFRRDVLLNAGIFVAFSSSNLIVLAFLPTILVDDFAMRAATASAISFVGAVVLIVGNVLAGWMLHIGFGRRAMLLAAFAGMTGFAAVLLISHFGQVPRVGSAILFSFCAGIPPAVVWTSIPLMARNPGEVPVLSGLLFQGAGIGQILGPVLAGWVVDTGGGWPMAFWAIAGLILCGVVLTLALPRAFKTHGA